jgi:hypothetical protein
MALNQQQQQIAQMLYQLAIQRGATPQHAREFDAAALAESTLRPRAVNATSGAGGLFQLLSRGYRQRAQQLGGIFNPRANALAILPEYLRYWRQHPHAAPGQAGAAVEASGAGAGFYSRGLGQLGNLGGGQTTAARSLGAPLSAPPPSGVSAAPDQQIGLALLQAIRPGPEHGNFGALYSTLEQQKLAGLQQHVQSRVQDAVANLQAAGKPITRGHLIRELFYDPLGGIKNGHEIGAIGHHETHDHVAMATLAAQLAVEQHARQMGMHVGEEQNADVHPVHVHDSYHYRNFPHSRYREAADVSGSPAQMAAFYRWVKANYG